MYINNQQNFDLWHRRLCHFDTAKIKDNLKNTNTNTNHKCQICSILKLRNKPFKRSINKTKHIFELIHLDLVGPVLPSLNKNIYFLTIWMTFLDMAGSYSYNIKMKHLINLLFGTKKF